MNSFLSQEKAKEQLEKGVYFDEAKKWYVETYISPYIERSYFIFFSIIAAMLSLFSIVILVGVMPLQKELTYVAVHPDFANEFMEMKKLATNEAKDPLAYEKKVVSVIAVQFVDAFERYEYNHYTKAKNMLNQFATDNIKKVYQREVSINNPRGRLLRYRQSTQRIISVLEDTVSVHTHRTDPNLAKGEYRVRMDFWANELGQGVDKKEKWQANVYIDYPGIHFDKNEDDYRSLDLTIYNYQSIIKDVAS